MLREPGNYVGNLATFAVTETKNGNDQFELDFNLTRDGNPTGEVVTVRVFLTEKCLAPNDEGREGISTQALNALGFNWKFDAPEFANSTDIGLWMKLEDYQNDKGETKTVERWNISTRRQSAPTPPDRLKRLNQTARAIVGGQAPAPAGRPTPPAARPAQSPASRQFANRPTSAMSKDPHGLGDDIPI